MGIKMMDGYGMTWLQSLNLRKTDCDWCYTPAVYVITKLSSRNHTAEGRAWEDRCCTLHRDKWFPVNPVVDLARKCEVNGCPNGARRWMGADARTDRLFGFTACGEHRGDSWTRYAVFIAPRAWVREYVWSARAA
jgi:hypothetical protein